jgi:hypothetical protein
MTERRARNADQQWSRLYYRYSHIGCPAARMEDNCAHPDRCADNGRCVDLGPNPMDAVPGELTARSEGK